MNRQQLYDFARAQMVLDFIVILILVACVVVGIYAITADINPHTQPTVDSVKVLVQGMGFKNVVMTDKSPITAGEICEKGEYYFEATAQTEAMADVKLGLCAVLGAVKIHSVTEVSK